MARFKNTLTNAEREQLNAEACHSLHRESLADANPSEEQPLAQRLDDATHDTSITEREVMNHIDQLNTEMAQNFLMLQRCQVSLRQQPNVGKT